MIIPPAKTYPAAFRPADRHELSGSRVRVKGRWLGLITHADRGRAYVRLDTDTAAWFQLTDLEVLDE